MVFIPGKSIVIWIFLERSRGKICSENCEREKERYFSFFFFWIFGRTIIATRRNYRCKLLQ